MVIFNIICKFFKFSHLLKSHDDFIGYGSSLSEQPSTNHVNGHRNIPNGISVNTSNLPIGSATVFNTDSGKIICVADVRGE